MSNVLQVAVPTPLWRVFEYLPPQDSDPSTLQPGIRLKIPFGRRECVGVLMGSAEHSSLSIAQLKTVQAILDEGPLIPASLLKLCRWASDYYHYPIGEVILGMLPPWLRQGKPEPSLGTLFRERERGIDSLQLNAHQEQAVQAINAANDFSVFLLSGVTGSGKTEVYLQCISKILAEGKQALVLVPEIALTPQTVSRFEARFLVPVVSLHSNLSSKKRAEAWLMAKNNIAKIIIGTRSAVFTPMAKPGIIILDEEHDTSFKQQTGFRYSARDVAVVRAHTENIPIVLGSATPSLESILNAKRGRYSLLTLPDRAGNSESPDVKLIDIRRCPLNAGMSETLVQAIEKHVKNNGQVMLFLNRRGFAPTLMCHHCGWVMPCDRCDARLTLHHHPKRLYCHHCGSNRKIPGSCPKCHQSEMVDVGLGTERLEEALHSCFPTHQIIRMDRDSTRAKNSIKDKLQKMHDQEATILIGTQMIAKGHHFSNLTLVAIVDADSGFFSADFRAVERMGQLLMQVSGRAGREEKIGEVLIQTHQPDNDLLKCLLGKGYDAFADVLLKERQVAQLPPFTHLALLRAEAVKPELPQPFLLKAKQFVAEHAKKNVSIFGPMPAMMERKAGRYRHQLLFQSENRGHLHQLLKQLTPFLSQQNARSVRWSLDVDPQETI